MWLVLIPILLKLFQRHDHHSMSVPHTTALVISCIVVHRWVRSLAQDEMLSVSPGWLTCLANCYKSILRSILHAPGFLGLFMFHMLTITVVSFAVISTTSDGTHCTANDCHPRQESRSSRPHSSGIIHSNMLHGIQPTCVLSTSAVHVEESSVTELLLVYSPVNFRSSVDIIFIKVYSQSLYNSWIRETRSHKGNLIPLNNASSHQEGFYFLVEYLTGTIFSGVEITLLWRTITPTIGIVTACSSFFYSRLTVSYVVCWIKWHMMRGLYGRSFALTYIKRIIRRTNMDIRPSPNVCIGPPGGLSTGVQNTCEIRSTVDMIGHWCFNAYCWVVMIRQDY